MHGGKLLSTHLKTKDTSMYIENRIKSAISLNIYFVFFLDVSIKHLTRKKSAHDSFFLDVSIKHLTRKKSAHDSVQSIDSQHAKQW